MRINIGKIDYPSFNSTNGIAMDIYMTGCTQYCKGCHNPELWDKNAGISMSFDEIIEIIESKKELDAIAVMGGEPMENPLLEDFLQRLYLTKKEIWLYTSFEFKDIPFWILDCCHYVKTGRFEIDLYCEGRLHSSNQKILKKIGKTFQVYYEYGGVDKILNEYNYSYKR